ncbi:MAG: glucose-1-phosphate adenylyltransferase [Anaerolineae bacterium]|nr:MAG: glucose-1-phosphate adenylyltransferase [Anaerolineae bacterium]
MKTRVVILAGGEGSRLGILTAKRTKPAVPFGGKYRIIDFALSNCINSELVDVMILAQYRPHSLIEHIGAGAPWDLNRDFTGGVRIYTPYKARGASDWYVGTADAVQQNFTFIKSTNPNAVLILSGDHIYKMDYRQLIAYHQERQADLTMATIRVPLEEASRFGVVEVSPDGRVTDFIEKPPHPPSNLANMGVYLFNLDVLDRALWEDQLQSGSSHDFGKDILPRLIAEGAKVYAYPYEDYWMDVGTVLSYWQAHMDLLAEPPRLNLNDRHWVIHTRTEERAPTRIAEGAIVNDSLLSNGCQIHREALVERSILSPGVIVEPGAVVREAILLTDVVIEAGACVERAVLDKRVRVGCNAHVGSMDIPPEEGIPMIGKNSIVPAGYTVEPGAVIATDVVPADYPSSLVNKDTYLETRRLPNEL